MPRCLRLVSGLVAALILAGAPAGTAAAADPCTGDANHDGAIDVDDIVAVVLAWGTSDSDADIDESGIVDIDDLVLVVLGFGPCLEPGVFPAEWIAGGPTCASDPDIQVHQYNDDLYILRQSKCTNFEGPFMYLLFGDDTVLLQDTGAGGGIQIGTTVYGIIDDWLAARGQASIELLVTHSHGHGDHTNGDGQFFGQPDTTVVGTSQASVATFFGITNWPTQIVSYDLGNRVIDIVPIPGHQSASIALYDRRTGLVFTGDTFYPGFLFITAFSEYVASIERLVDFLEDKPVCWILGTHIEMSATPFVPYPYGSTWHPDERELQLTRDHLLELRQGVRNMQADPVTEAHADFVIDPF